MLTFNLNYMSIEIINDFTEKKCNFSFYNYL